MTAKGGGRVPLEQFFAMPRERGAAVGLTFNFEAIEKAPNTLLSHRLVYLTPEAQRPALLEALFAAYFEHGQDIGDAAVLADVAASVGLDGPATAAALAGDGGTTEVLADVAYARQVGISGVPFFIFNQRYALSGAQPVEVMRRVLEEIRVKESTDSTN
jgi:predicted DsbA family dithiol-disulfide isomerase